MAYRSSSTATQTTGTSITGSAPAGTASTDVLIAYLSKELNVAVSSAPTGWTQITAVGTEEYITVWWALGTVSDFVWTHGLDTSNCHLIITALTGRDTTTQPTDKGDSFNNDGTGNITNPSKTAVAGDDLLAYFRDAGRATALPGTYSPAGLTHQLTTSSGSTFQHALATQENLSAGATTAYTTVGTAFDGRVGTTILVKAASGSTATTAWLTA
jgi:hypothetical protein